ncbi:MAG TPA: secretin N-terminal domain-containing protein [Longimicrobium sp.]
MRSQTVHRALAAALACLLLAAPPASAQVRINYQDAELTTVISALAEMAGLNVVFVGVDPATRVTIKMGRPIAPDEIPGLIRTILESAGFATVDRGGILQVVPAGQAPTLGETQVFVHPLRHASATELALTLAAIYGSTDAANAAAGDTRGRRSLSEQLRSERNGSAIATFPGSTNTVTGSPLGGAGRDRPTLSNPNAGQAPVVGGLMVGEAAVVPYTATNSLIIRTTPRNYELLRQTIDRLDTRPLQVVIEVFVAEVTLDKETQFGVDWVARLGNSAGGQAVRSVERFRTLADTTPGGAVVTLGFTEGDFDVRATLRAIAADARVNVLATPSVLARNNEEARILVGSQVPFTQIARSGLSGEVLDRVVQFRDVGTELAIVPTINQDGYVTLSVLQQVSTLTNQTLFGAPIITVREAQTSAVVRDRQTVVIGGLIGSEESRFRRGIPILKDIPLLGYLFRDTETRGRKTELVIFLTPYLVESDADLERLRERSIERTNSRQQIRRELDRNRLDSVRVVPSAPVPVPPAPQGTPPAAPVPPVTPQAQPARTPQP